MGFIQIHTYIHTLCCKMQIFLKGNPIEHLLWESYEMYQYTVSAKCTEISVLQHVIGQNSSLNKTLLHFDKFFVPLTSEILC